MTLQSEEKAIREFYGDDFNCSVEEVPDEPKTREDVELLLSSYDEAIALYEDFLEEEKNSVIPNISEVHFLQKEIQKAKVAKREILRRYTGKEEAV